MAKSNRPPAKATSKRTTPQPPSKRTSNAYGIGGSLVTLLLVFLYWWFTGSVPPSAIPTSDPAAGASAAIVTDAPAAETPTTSEAVARIATATEAVAAAAPATSAPTVAALATAVATAAPMPTATKPPKPTPSPNPHTQSGPPGMAVITHDELPPEAIETLNLIAAGGPFPYARDGITFQNREQLLPRKPRAYYREYTVVTPGESDRGARRIVAGENGELYYTDDHYDSFYWIAEP